MAHELNQTFFVAGKGASIFADKHHTSPSSLMSNPQRKCPEKHFHFRNESVLSGVTGRGTTDGFDHPSKHSGLTYKPRSNLEHNIVSSTLTLI